MNGLLLPALDSIARKNSLPLHFGSHPNYNRRVAGRLNEIRSMCEAVRSDLIRDQLAHLSVRALQMQLRHSIMNHGYGSIDDIPLHGETDRDLDAMLDGLDRYRTAKNLVA
jgi:A nuclease family of the HNH/ENDO VII superfamily with conserved AHH